MVENVHANPQFVGQADARKAPTIEAPKQGEFILSSEQKLVADAINKGSERLEQSILDARESAGKNLQKTTGKELIAAGKKQMIRGVWDTVKAEVVMGVAGAVGGALAGKIGENSLRNIATLADEPVPTNLKTLTKITTAAGAVTAGMFAPEASTILYALKTRKDASLPKTKWYDYLLSRSITGLTTLPIIANSSKSFLDAFKNENLHTWADFGDKLGADMKSTKSLAFAALPIVAQTVLNPTTIAGFRNVLIGMRMEKGA